MVGYNSTISSITRCCHRLTTTSNTFIRFSNRYLTTTTTSSTTTTTTRNTFNNKSLLFSIQSSIEKGQYITFNHHYNQYSTKSSSSTTSKRDISNPLESSSLFDRERININFIEPDNIKPFKPRLAPYHTQATLDFLIAPGQRQFSPEEIDKFANLAKALSSIGYEHQTNDRFKEAMESYNKALLYVRNVFSQDKNRISLREYAVLMINIAETMSRLDNVKDAILRSKQAIDLLEIDWKNQYDAEMELEQSLQQHEKEQQQQKTIKGAKSKTPPPPPIPTSSVRKSWIKDELLGVAYQNHAEYLVYEQKHQEAEPFIRVAHGILSKIYPLDHPVNVDNGMLLIQVLNENGRHDEVRKVNEKYGTILTEASGQQNEAQEGEIYEKINKDMMESLENTIREKYPGVLEEHEAEAERLAKEIESEKGTNKELEYLDDDQDLEELENGYDEDDEDDRNLYAEPQFKEDDLNSLEEEVYSLGNAKRKKGSSVGFISDEKEFVQSRKKKEIVDDGSIDDKELSKYAEDEEAEEEAQDEFMNEISQEEQELGKKYVADIDKPLISPEELKSPSDFVLNKLDALLSKGVEEYSALERAKLIDRDRRIKNKASDVVDQVFAEDGKILTPTNEFGDPISQSNLQKIGRYHAEELMQPEMEEEKDLMDNYMGKIMKLAENMSSEELTDIDEKFKDIEPILAQFVKADDKEAKKFFNFSFQDVEEEEKQQQQKQQQTKENNKKKQESLEDDFDLSDLKSKEKDFVMKNPDLMRNLMGQVEKHGFNLDEIAKNINLEDYKDLDFDEDGEGELEEGGDDFESILKKMSSGGGVDQDDEFDSDIFKEFDFEGLEDDADEDGIEYDKEDEDENLELFIKQARQDQDLDEFFKNRKK